MNCALNSLASPGFPEGEEKRLSDATSPGREASATSEAPSTERLGRRLLRNGIVLFLRDQRV